MKLGRHHTEEEKKKIGNANRGHVCSLETREKMSLAHKDPSQETRARMSLAQMGRTGEKAARWKGGIQGRRGRIKIKVPGHPLAMEEDYVYRYHLVMEKKLGRYLKPEEVVHHRNGIAHDDRLRNLRLFPNQSEHTRFHNKLRGGSK
jgi:hypothetical protein